jgi:hypothetical protein
MKFGIIGTAAAVLAFATAGAASASVFQVSSAAGMGANDSIDWGQLGVPFTSFSSPLNVTSGGGLNTVVSSAGNYFLRMDEGVTWAGNFANGEHLLWDGGTSFGADGPDITLTFATPVKGAGAKIQADFYGPFTAEIIGSNGGVLGTFTRNGYSNGGNDNSAIFLGMLSSGRDIKQIRFDLTSAVYDTGDFAIGTVALNTVPEPATWGLMLVGFGGLGAALRLRRRQAAALA